MTDVCIYSVAWCAWCAELSDEFPVHTRENICYEMPRKFHLDWVQVQKEKFDEALEGDLDNIYI